MFSCFFIFTNLAGSCFLFSYRYRGVRAFPSFVFEVPDPRGASDRLIPPGSPNLRESRKESLCRSPVPRNAALFDGVGRSSWYYPIRGAGILHVCRIGSNRVLRCCIFPMTYSGIRGGWKSVVFLSSGGFATYLHRIRAIPFLFV